MAVRRLILCIVLALLGLGNVPCAADEPVSFFQQHCLACHGATKQEGDFRLDTLARDFAQIQVAQKWAEVMTRVNAGEMPPPDHPAPSAAEIEQVVDWIDANLRAAEAERQARRAPVELYRLSRDEYAATVQDMLGVYFDPHLPGAFNEDPRWHGFERLGSQLTLSPSHIDRYLRAAEVVLERAFPAEPPKTHTVRVDAVELRHRDRRQQLEALGIASKVRAVLWPGANVPAWRAYWANQVREAGLYRCRMQLSGLTGLNGRAPHVSIWHNGLKRTLFDEDLVASEEQPIVVEFTTFLTHPAELELRNEVPRVFSDVGNHTLNVLNLGGSVFTTSRERERINPTGYKLFTDDGRAIHPTLLVDWIEWEGPLVSEADQRRRAPFIPQSEDHAALRACLERFAARAWRRPVTAAEVDRFFAIYTSEREAGEKFRSAWHATLAAVLTSKNFCYLEQGSATQRSATLDDFQLASRLSYFLWGSLPDEPLLATAAAGKLLDRKELQRELERMLADDKIRRFTAAFPRQWLQLDRVGMFPPDARLYPDYDLWLEKSMVQEPIAFFGEVFQRNLSLREFLHSDWTMVNARLARHYGLPPVTEPGMQRVALRPENHRGGLLTQAAVLMLTSDGTRHRPVHRGVWVSETIFGKTPPPPPPNVEPLAPTPAAEPKATIRQQLEAHTTHATCAACHRKIDPLGFAFDEYDAVGQWRTTEFVSAGKGDNPAVNAAGVLPDGRPFQNAAEFKTLLAADMDRFARAFVEQLAVFALRRVMTHDDAPQLEAITARARQKHYALRAVLEELVLSDLFQTR